MEKKYSATKREPIYKTIIDHKKRLELELTMDQYALADAIEQVIDKYKDFDSKRDYDRIYRRTGIKREFYPSLGKALFVKDIISPIPETNKYILTAKWKGNNEEIIKKEFEKLWIRSGKVGNKQAAFKMFKKAVKEDPIEYLFSRWSLYEAFLKTSTQSQLHLSSWLNPENKRYNDEWKESAFSKKKDTNQIKGIFGNDINRG